MAGVSAHVCKPCQAVLCVTSPTPQLPRAQLWHVQCSCPRLCNTSTPLQPVPKSRTLAVRAGRCACPLQSSFPFSRSGAWHRCTREHFQPSLTPFSSARAAQAAPAPRGAHSGARSAFTSAVSRPGEGAAGTGFSPPNPSIPAPQPRTALGTIPRAGSRAHPGG